ncbi:hypothetical protein EES37_37755 [Streptomyces sp. ADI91-18]|uniref:hypothetical protein n=1 Tax=Streptomyces sp. ADI91-18 TaxID=1522755 RepID=UPI000F558CC7|nr:hypothetical protein [Streptomyces sp. ADI91-18]RPK23974.1 hypothetical protein EES37_37755 [Streptomyces sp. ADI91-18]
MHRKQCKKSTARAQEESLRFASDCEGPAALPPWAFRLRLQVAFEEEGIDFTVKLDEMKVGFSTKGRGQEHLRSEAAGQVRQRSD